MAELEHDFEVVWEIEPPLRADVGLLHAQLASATDVATSILVPDTHTGRATASSIAIARAVAMRGRRATACLNARDRNLLGLRRDLLTCAFDGVDDLLLVYGDEPDIGARASDLTVRMMVEECRLQAPHLRVGVTTSLRAVPAWKLAADRLFVQVSYDVDALLRWRDRITFAGPVYRRSWSSGAPRWLVAWPPGSPRCGCPKVGSTPSTRNPPQASSSLRSSPNVSERAPHSKACTSSAAADTEKRPPGSEAWPGGPTRQPTYRRKPS
jgi:hypothetical protein